MDTEEVIERYKQGKCIYCTAIKPKQRRPEIRRRLGDVFCHACRNSWPLEMEAAELAQIAVSVQEKTSLKRVSFPEEEFAEVAVPSKSLLVRAFAWLGRKLVRL